MKKNLISVIMGVHNEKEEYLLLAVDSILKQTYNELEFIIIDDQSDEHCEGLLKEIASKDSRIRLYRNETNLGLTKSLNRALSYAEGEYIARMDADDFSIPERFEKQVAYLRTHSDIDILGGGVVSFGDSCEFFSPAFGYTNEQAQCDLFFQSTLCHPSVMMRRSFLDKHHLSYDENVKKGQDYDMWERCSVHGKLAVMEDVVLYYRVHAAQITSTNRKDQDGTARMVRTRRLGRIGLTPTEEEYKCHLMLLGLKDKSVGVREVKDWMDKILEANRKNPIADDKTLTNNLQNRFVLFKARHGKKLILDLPLLLKTAVSRIRMRTKLKKVANRINETIK